MDLDIQKRLKEIEQQIKTARTNALRFYDDTAEVQIQYQIIDELLEEKAWLINHEQENQAAQAAWDNQNILDKE